MTTASIFEAKTNLSKYVNSLINKEDNYVLILKNGIPVAKLTAYDEKPNVKIGLAKDAIPKLDSVEAFNSINLSEDFYSDGGLI